MIHDTEVGYDDTIASSRTRTPTSARTTSRARPTATSRRWSRRRTSPGTPAIGGSTRTRSGSRTRASRLDPSVVHERALPLARAADALHRPSATASRSTASTSSATTRCRARRPPTRPGCTGIRARTSTGRTSWRSSARRSRRERRQDGPHRHDRPELQDEPAARDRLRHELVPHAAVAADELRLPAHGAERSLAARRRPAPRRASGSDLRAETGATRPSPASASPSPSRPGDWLAIWYGGQKAWLDDPHGQEHGRRQRPARHAEGGHRLDPGLRARVSVERLDGDARLHDPGRPDVRREGPRRRRLLQRLDVRRAGDVLRRHGHEQFYEISFNHRIAFLKATDVDVLR